MSEEAVQSNSIETCNNNAEAESFESTACSGNNGTSESDLAKGLSSIISSVITDFDSRAQQTILSQHQLSSSIDRLTRGSFQNFSFKLLLPNRYVLTLFNYLLEYHGVIYIFSVCYQNVVYYKYLDLL